MIGTVIGILLVLLFLGVCWWGLQQLLAAFPVAEPFRTIIHVVSIILLVVICIWVIIQLLAIAGIRVPFF